MFLHRVITIMDPDSRVQKLVVLPSTWVKRFKVTTEIEMFELAMGSLLIRLVEHTASYQGTRYKLVRHHGSGQLSVPRRWLRDRAALPGDKIEIWESPSHPDRLLLRFYPSVSNPQEAGLLTAPTTPDFLRQGERIK